MPTNRTLFTLLDIKKLISEKHKIPVEKIRFYCVFNFLITLEENLPSAAIVKDNTYMLQFDDN